MMASAFHFLLTGDTTYAEPVKTELLNQIAQAGTDFSNTTKFAGASGCGVRDGAWDGNVIGTTAWLSHHLYAYDYLLAGGYTGFSAANKTAIETWLQNASRYFVGRSNRSVTQWAYRNARPPYGGTPDYTTCNGAYGGGGACPGGIDGLTYFGGNQVYGFSSRWNNRIMTACMFGMPAAILGVNGIKDNQTIQDCTFMVQEMLRFATFSDGMVGDIWRWSDATGTPQGAASAWTHGYYQLGAAMVAADALARTGNTILYTFTSPSGYAPAGTDGNKVSLLSGMLIWARMANGTVSKYGTSQSNQQDNAHLITWKVEGGHSEDFTSALANIYYQNNEVKTSYNRTGPFTSGCGNAACQGTPWGIYPHVLFMFGQMEGVVWPYLGRPSSSLPAPLRLRIKSVD
jgi:hypothetical protein